MPQYNFYQDRKIIIWERSHYTVEAKTETEAKKIVENQQINYTGNMTGIVEGKRQMLTDTTEIITMEDNCGFATIENYYDNGAQLILISSNGIDIEDR